MVTIQGCDTFSAVSVLSDMYSTLCAHIIVWDHMDYLNTMMLAELNDTYEIRHVYEMGPKLRGYAALMNDEWVQCLCYFIIQLC